MLLSFYIVILSIFNMLGLFVHTHAPSSCRSYNPPRETNPNKYTKNTAHRKRRKFKKIILILDQNRSKLQDRRSEEEEKKKKVRDPKQEEASRPHLFFPPPSRGGGGGKMANSGDKDILNGGGKARKTISNV